MYGLNLKNLTIGDWVELQNGEIGVVQSFAYFNGKRWKKVERWDKANGILFWFRNGPDYETIKFVHCKEIKDKLNSLSLL